MPFLEQKRCAAIYITDKTAGKGSVCPRQPECTGMGPVGNIIWPNAYVHWVGVLKEGGEKKCPPNFPNLMKKVKAKNFQTNK